MLSTSAIKVDRDYFSHAGKSTFVVHSVFSHAVNLVSTSDLVGIVTTDRAIGPRGVVIDLPSFDGVGLTPGEPASLAKDRLVIGGRVRIDLTRAAIWSPPACAATLDTGAVAVFESEMAPHPFGGGVEGGFGEWVREALNERAAAFREALASPASPDAERVENCAAAAVRLLGLGHGLTPSGDDWLVGFAVAAAHFGGPLEPAIPAIREALRRGSTVALSSSALHSALEGRAIEPLHNLLAALTGAKDPDVGRALSDLMAIGHTSGTDMAHGLLAAVLHLAKYEE